MGMKEKEGEDWRRERGWNEGVVGMMERELKTETKKRE